MIVMLLTDGRFAFLCEGSSVGTINSRVSINYKIIFASSLQMLLFFALGDAQRGILGIDIGPQKQPSTVITIPIPHSLTLSLSLSLTLALSRSLSLSRSPKFISLVLFINRSKSFPEWPRRSRNHFVGTMTPPRRAQIRWRNI